MKQDKEFNRILNECLERLLQGDTIEQCLQKYPDQTTELEPLLRTATAVKKVSAITPNPVFRARAREEFQTALQEMGAKRGFRFFGLQSWVATAVTVLLAVVVLGSGTVAAAGNTMPGQPLYPVKLATEQIQITLTFSELGKAELYSKLADKRVSEIVYAASKGDSGQVVVVAQRLDTYLNEAAVLAGAPAETAEVASSPTAQPSPMLSVPAPVAQTPQVMETPPVSVEPSPEQTREGVAPVPAPAPSVTATAPASQAVSKDAKVVNLPADKRAELNSAVRNKSVENVERLKAALATTPESAKPALEQAIKRAEAGYRKVIEATKPERALPVKKPESSQTNSGRSSDR